MERARIVGQVFCPILDAVVPGYRRPEDKRIEMPRWLEETEGLGRDIAGVDRKLDTVGAGRSIAIIGAQHVERIFDDIQAYQQYHWQQCQQAEQDKSFETLFAHGLEVVSIAVDDFGNGAGIIGSDGMGDRQ